jgi:hypothetical protein
MKQKPLVDELLENYFPKKSYDMAMREKAKAMTLEFFKLARQEYAMQDEINTEIFLGRPLKPAERNRILKSWGYEA